MIDFYFFHIGDETDLPYMMINSIRKTNKDSRIFQLTDKKTNQIKITDDCYRFDGNKNSLMKLRFELLNLSSTFPWNYEIVTTVTSVNC